MVDVSLRHKRITQPGPQRAATGTPAASPIRAGARTPGVLSRPIPIAAAAITVVLVLLFGLWWAVGAWQDSTLDASFTSETTPVDVRIGNERLAIPANMIRSARVRRGGETERLELAIHWPTLGGYSEDRADDFRADTASAPIVYLTIGPREMAADSTGRLADVYATFFTGPASPGPNGLVGRKLSADSGYGGEIVYFAPAEAQPFVARCLDLTADMPATCLRDINFGGNLSLLYRFDRSLLSDWQALDAGIRGLASRFLGG
jgi:hypothetical protein